MTHNEELVGGCCVCSDDQGFSNNALVYCDGKGCTVACHTACYGIVSIPDGDWLCRRCEANEIQAPCCLCPMIDGAMKRTSDGNWAHVICALYIPEVLFGNDATMEPIILTKIPSIRYGQICSICIKNGRSKSDAIKGACCQCIIKTCTQVFHVTCAQQEGLLYEDVRKNNCQYPIYCEQHRPKFSKFIRQIPAFRYKSSEIKHNSKEKINSSQLSDFVSTKIHESSLLGNKQTFNDNTSQNLLTNNSKFMKINENERNSLLSSNQNQLIKDNRELSTDTSKLLNTNIEQESLTSICSNIYSNDNTNLPLKKISTSKIKTEENDIDNEIIEKIKLNKDIQSHKKRQYSTEECPKLVDHLPLKKTLLSKEKFQNDESLNKINQISIDINSHKSLKNSSITQQQEHKFPPDTLEEFLEQEWETTSDFLLQQTMPHDISSLLSCLYQFKSENADLQKKSDELKHRRDTLRVTNVNLRRKLSELLTINNQDISQKTKSSIHENQIKLTKNSSSQIEFFPNNSNFSSSSIPYESINPYTMIKNEQIPSTNNLSLELLSQILAINGPQLFAPTWNISNFGYANFPGANSISISDESILRSYSSFEQ